MSALWGTAAIFAAMPCVAAGPGGWPIGSEKREFGFVRLQYDGSGWDAGTGAASRATANFVETFEKLTRFKMTLPTNIPIDNLRLYAKGATPPFVYMTGDGEIRIPAKDIRTLRDYLVGGGMLFADAGSTQWDENFRGFMQRLFPEKAWQVIADDDPIFQVPFLFEDGAPPLSRYGGEKAKGINNEGRWLVFYHPGGIGNAWKPAQSAKDKDFTKGAMELGVNIVYYAIIHHMAATRDVAVTDGVRPHSKLTVDKDAPLLRNKTATRSFAKGVLTIQPAGEEPVPISGHPPWAFCDLESIRSFASASGQDKDLGLIQRRIVREKHIFYGNDITTVLTRLSDSPVEIYELYEQSAEDEVVLGLLLGVGEERYVMFVFSGDRSLKASRLQDTFVVTIQQERVTVLWDLIPRFEGPTPAGIRRLLARYDSPFEYISPEDLATRIKKARTPDPAVIKKLTAVARPDEIPSSPAVETKDLSRELDNLEAKRPHTQ